MSTASSSLFALVYGRVQGVYFRAFVAQKAQALNLKGYVCNLPEPEGSVEVRAEGDRETLEELLGHLRQGPPRARVDKVEVTWGQASGAFDRFDIHY